MHDLIEIELAGRFYRNAAVQSELSRLEGEVEAGRESASAAAGQLIASYFQNNPNPA